jgi:hypothetical protein
MCYDENYQKKHQRNVSGKIMQRSESQRKLKIMLGKHVRLELCELIQIILSQQDMSQERNLELSYQEYCGEQNIM